MEMHNIPDYGSEGFLLNALGPGEDYGGWPSFNIMRIHYDGDFESEVERQADLVVATGQEYRSMITEREIDGHEARTAHYNAYLADRDFYAWTDQVFIDEAPGRILVITFTARTGYWYNVDYDFYKSIGLFEFTD